MDSKASSSTPDVSPPVVQAPVLAPVMDAMKTVESVKDNVGNVKEKAMESVQNVVAKATASNASVIISGLLIGLGVASIVALSLYWMLTRGVGFKKVGYLVPGTKTPVVGYDTRELSTEGMPGVRNELSVSFWIYVNDIRSFDTQPESGRPEKLVRHVWHIGNSVTNPLTAGPLVSIVSVRSNTSPQKNVLAVSFKHKTDGSTQSYNVENVLKAAAERGFIFDYIPVKRWVNYTLTVSMSTDKVVGYADGQQIKETDLQSLWTQVGISTTPPKKELKDNIELSTENMFIGGKATSEVGLGFAGLVSSIRFYNYVQTKNEVYAQYKRGPIDNVFAKLGLPAYGVRPPVYKIGDAE